VLAHRALRYLVSGGVTTLVAYIATILLLRIMNYVPATVFAWVATVAVGFTLNRRFTFGITGANRRAKDLGLFVIGALLQLCMTIAGYSITLGRMDLDPSLAFAINLALTTAFGFAFLNLVTFRRAV
jgi:putative flippase GtrA